MILNQNKQEDKNNTVLLTVDWADYSVLYVTGLNGIEKIESTGTYQIQPGLIYLGKINPVNENHRGVEISKSSVA